MNEIDILKKQLAREKLARKEAEDILEKKSDELYDVNTQLKNIANNLVLQHVVSSALVNSSSQEVAIGKILQGMSEKLEMKVANMWEVDPSSSLLNLYASYCIEGSPLKKFSEACKQDALSVAVGLPGRVLQSKKIQQISDVVQDPDFFRKSMPVMAGIHGALAFPLFIDNRVIGVIALYTDQIKEFDSMLLSVITDIGNQIGIFLEREQVRKSMLDAQRIAGMTEVTTSMLHNIGNILNSVNVSISLLEEKFKQSKLDNLLLLRDLLKQHVNDMTAFILQSDQGMHLPSFLMELGDHWQSQKENIKQEISSLSQNVQHINDILKSQRFLSGSFGMVEPMQINTMLNDAVRINTFTLHSSDVVIQKQYEDLPPIVVDRIKLMQILVNLVRNAFQALSGNTTEKKIVLRITTDKKMVCIQVNDNGQGIEKNNLLKIFTYGFTTKKGGHGFGLHADALSAQEMGGSLTVESEGLNTGATFSLTLPYRLPERDS